MNNLFQGGLRSRQLSNRYPKWTAAYIIETSSVAKLYRGRIPAMFATDPNLKILLSFAPTLDSNLHKLSDSCLVKACKRVIINNFSLLIIRQERTRVVPTETETCLCEIVCPEAEKFGNFGNLVSV